jgi:hypothetical protein
METTYRVIDALNEHHIPQLMDLYCAEWWTRTRTVEQVRDVLKWSDLAMGLCSEPGERLVAFTRVLTDRTFNCRPELVTFYEGFGFKPPDSGVLLMRRSAASDRQIRMPRSDQPR